jgi:hypothetical protein
VCHWVPVWLSCRNLRKGCETSYRLELQGSKSGLKPDCGSGRDPKGKVRLGSELGTRLPSEPGGAGTEEDSLNTGLGGELAGLDCKCSKSKEVHFGWVPK